MRVAFVVAAAIVVALAGVQAVSVAVLRDRAQPGSLLLLIPRDATRALLSAVPRRAATPALRLLLARADVESGDPLAAAHVAALPAGRDRASLEGMLAESRGQYDAAIRDYLVAGDMGGLEREARRFEIAGDTGGAVRLQRAIVARLALDPTQPDALAEAYWRLGLAEQLDGYMHYPIDSRRPWAVRAMAAYVQAVALAPLSEKYLIAAGSQEINLDDARAAQRYFERARDADPTSAQAWAGLAALALRAGDRATARRDAARATRLNPSLPAVQRLNDDLRR